MTSRQKCLSFNMFNVFPHRHVHRWTTNEEKICLWICLTFVECNWILIWVQRKTSLHSAAVEGRLRLRYLCSCPPNMQPMFLEGKSNQGKLPTRQTLLDFLRLKGHYLFIFKRMLIVVPVNWAPQGHCLYWQKRVCGMETQILTSQMRFNVILFSTQNLCEWE